MASSISGDLVSCGDMSRKIELESSELTLTCMNCQQFTLNIILCHMKLITFTIILTFKLTIQPTICTTTLVKCWPLYSYEPDNKIQASNHRNPVP